MDRIKALAFLVLSIFILFDVYASPALAEGPIGISVRLENEPWSKWVIPVDPITLSSSGDMRSGSVRDASFASNNADGFYLVAFMGNGGHLVNDGGRPLENPLEIKFPSMAADDPEPMMEDSIDGYPGYGYAYHMYSPGSYEGNIEVLQKISESDLEGTYSGTLSIALSYPIDWLE